MACRSAICHWHQHIVHFLSICLLNIFFFCISIFQLVIKKTCEWWFYKNKCRNMSTHWKQNAFLICCVILFGLLLGLIIWCQPGSSGSSSRKGAHITAGVSNKSNTWTSSRGYPPVVDSPDIQTIFINHSFIGDEQWTEDGEFNLKIHKWTKTNI